MRILVSERQWFNLKRLLVARLDTHNYEKKNTEYADQQSIKQGRRPFAI